MGWRGWFTGRRVGAGARLLRQLTTAAREPDGASLERLCAERADEIAARFPAWLEVERAHAEEARRSRARALDAVAACFETRLGRPELRALLGGAAQAAGWSPALFEAERRAARGDAAGAAAVLGGELARLRALLAATLAHLGRAEAARGRSEDAAAAFREALALFEARGDRGGVVAALASLVEVERRAGDLAAAAADARRLAAECAQAGDDAGTRRYGDLARALSRRRDEVR